MVDPTPAHPASLRAANVIVVLNASDRDHFAVSGEVPYRAARPPWANLTFLADHDIAGRLVDLLGTGEVDAVVFASNALSSKASQRAVSQRRFVEQWKDGGPAQDVGVVILHQYLRPDERLPLDFLGGGAFTLVGAPARRVLQPDIDFRSDWRFVEGVTDDVAAARFHRLAVGYGRERHAVWARCELGSPTEWEELAAERGKGALVAVCRSGDRVVISSLVPIDLTGEHELLRSLIAECLRPRGCLLVEAPGTIGTSAFSTSLASALDRQRFIERVRPGTTGEIDPGAPPYRFFDELIVAPEWPVASIASLTEKAVLRKLEEGGSIVATFDGLADRSITVRLSGQPQYAERANRLAAWLLPRLAAFKGDVWAMRALAEVVAATRAAYVDERLIPQALRASFVDRQLAGALAKRGDGESVDEIVLPTVATYTALEVLGRSEIDAMRAWVHQHLDREVPSVIAQALVMDPKLESQARRARVKEAAGGKGDARDDTELLNAYAAILLRDEDPDLLTIAAAGRSLGLGVQAELLRAFANARLAPTDAIVELSANVRSQIDRLAGVDGALEAVCLGNAALIALARQQGIGPNAAIRGRPREVDARTVAATNLAMDAEEARRDSVRYRRLARVATTALFAALTIATIALVVTILVWTDYNLNARFGFATGVFALISSFNAFLLKKAHAAGVPPWPLS